VYLDAGPR